MSLGTANPVGARRALPMHSEGTSIRSTDMAPSPGAEAPRGYPGLHPQTRLKPAPSWHGGFSGAPYEPVVGEQLACSRRLRPRRRESMSNVSGPNGYASVASGGGKLLPYARWHIPIPACCSRLSRLSAGCPLGALAPRRAGAGRVDSIDLRHRGKGTACRAPTDGNQPRPTFGASERLCDRSPWFQPGVSEPGFPPGNTTGPMGAQP